MNKNIFAFKEYEQKWKEFTFEKKQGKYIYILEMWPYTSGSLHMGHVRNYTIGDIISRLKHLQGFCVLHPMGWDAHGLPAENAAKEYNIHPKIWTQNNITQMKQQMESMFFSYDWDHELSTCDKSYYKHQQKLFIEMFKAGYIKKKEEYVNWDPVDQTVLANEQVVNGKGWRSGAAIQQKLLSQWFFTISDFSEILLKDLDLIEDNWPAQILTMQRNWIGKNQGYGIKFDFIEIFTKSPSCLGEVEFIAVAPNSIYGIEFFKKYIHVQDFVTNNPVDKTIEDQRGIFTTEYVNNPFNSKKLPVYIANYVLGDYGTGAIMAVPSLCQNDYNFAVYNNINIIYPVKIQDYLNTGLNKELQEFHNLLLDKKIVYEKTVYKLKDWCISRQRYWGTPIPIIYCDTCGIVCNDNLPVELSYQNEDKSIICPQCQKIAIKETDTMDTFVDSSWYSWKYPCAKSENIFDDNLKKYPAVDLYIGGPEHAVLHLLFARFFGKMLKNLGYIEESEPFRKFYAQGMICMPTYKTKNTNKFIYPQDVYKKDNILWTLYNDIEEEVIMGSWEKMSKSKKNTISPQDILNSYGVDALRLFIVSDTPCYKDLKWNENSLNGCWSFINRIWKLTHEIKTHEETTDTQNIIFQEYASNIYYNIIENLENININIAISHIRIFINYLEEHKKNITSVLLQSRWVDFLKLLWCICPVISLECLELLVGNNIEFDLPFNKAKDHSGTYELVIQKNGKKFNTINVSSDLDQNHIKDLLIKQYPQLSNYQNIVFVKYKIINFVI
jgi:leucyl-tRNA synthetase